MEGSPEEGNSSGEHRERIADPASLLWYLEDLGEEMETRFRTEAATEMRPLSPSQNLGIQLPHGRNTTVRLTYQTAPMLHRNFNRQAVHLPDMWLESGSLEVIEKLEDNTQIVTAYKFGRGLSKDPHDAVLCFIYGDVAEKDGGIIRRRPEIQDIFADQDEMDFIKGAFRYIEEQLRANPTLMPTDKPWQLE